MLLQHSRRADLTPFLLRDFFWGCSGFYVDGPQKCRGKCNISLSDVEVLHKADIPELQVGASELNIIFGQGPVQQTIVRRVREHLGEEDDAVLCPVHHSPMRVQEKEEQVDYALDMF